MVTLGLIVFLGLAALAIDLGLLYVARGEAQRAADAAAHAGASYFMENLEATDDEIADEAIRIGLLNAVRGEASDIQRTDVEVIRDERKVRVWAHRTAKRENPVRTLFAGVLGMQTVDVNAMAAAQIWPATGAQCVLPIAIPDRWCISGIGPDGPCAEYSDGLDSGETFEEGHYYVPWLHPHTEEPNEYWTGFSEENYGDPLTIKPQDPHRAIQPGWFYAFRLPGVQGGAEFRDAISGCQTGNTAWGVGDYVDTEPGNMEEPTEDGFNALIDKYPDAYWDHQNNKPAGNPDHIAGRTRPIVVFNPENPPEQGSKPFQVANFAAVFVEGFDSNGDIQARFVRLTGLDPSPLFDPSQGGAGTQLSVVRIVE